MEFFSYWKGRVIHVKEWSMKFLCMKYEVWNMKYEILAKKYVKKLGEMGHSLEK